MAINIDGTLPTTAKCDSKDLNFIICDDKYVWVKQFVYSIRTVNEYVTPVATRLSSPYAGAPLGALKSEDPIYYGDVVEFSKVVRSGCTMSQNQLTVSSYQGDGTSDLITSWPDTPKSYTIYGNIYGYLQATPKSYSLSVSSSYNLIETSCSSIDGSAYPNNLGTYSILEDGTPLYQGDSVVLNVVLRVNTADKVYAKQLTVSASGTSTNYDLSYSPDPNILSGLVSVAKVSVPITNVQGSVSLYPNLRTSYSTFTLTIDSSDVASIPCTVKRLSSPIGAASIGTLSSGATLYSKDVLEISLGEAPAWAKPYINSGTVYVDRNYTSGSSPSLSFGQTTTITIDDNNSYGDISITYKVGVYGNYFYMYAENYSSANGSVTCTRTSSPSGKGSIGALSNSSYVYAGDVIQCTLNIPSGTYCIAAQYENSSGGALLQKITTKTSTYTVTGECSINVFTYFFGFTSLSSLGYTVSGTSITKYSGSSSSITIPSKYYSIKLYDGSTISGVIATSSSYNVNSYVDDDKIISETLIDTIGDNAFKSNSSLEFVVLTTYIKKIGSNAFAQCPNLLDVEFKTTPTSIGSYAFWLTKIYQLSSYMYNCTSLGEGCFATYDGWYLAAPSGSTSLGGDAVINRLKATSANTDYGRVYEVRARFNVHKGGGDNGLSGGSFSCTCKVQVKGKNNTRQWTTLSASCSYGSNKSGVTYAVCGPSVTLTESFSMSSQPSNYSTWRSGCANKTLNAGGTCDHDCYAQVDSTCLTEHTLLTLSNGSRKRADQITYKDMLLCYNFETGKQDYQYPLAITRGETHDHFTRIHLENNLYIDICGHHDIYDPKKHMFRTYGDGNITSVVLGDYYILDDSNQIVKIKSIERIEKEVTAYCIVTSGTTTAYADTAMVGMQHMNYSRIGEDNKFTKAFETDKLLCYDYNTFKREIYDEPEQDLILGLNLHYAHYYNKDASGLPRLLAPLKRRIPLPQYKNENLYTLGFIDKELKEIESVQDEIIVLPEIKSKGKTKWYIVGEYKYLNPGDTYITKFSTVIRAV